jgi:hypothetical protein
MKKAFMLVAAIALLAAPVFAEVEVTISGEATTSFGYNLDTEVYGMLSEVSSDVELAIGSLDGESMGEGAWYGVIELTGAALSFGTDLDGDELLVMVDPTDTDDDAEFQIIDIDGDGDDEPVLVATNYVLTAPDVTAKITNGNIYIQLQSEADLDADYVDDEDLDDQALDFDAEDLAGSMTIGGTFAPVTFAVEFGMAGDYEDDAQVDGIGLGLNLGVDLAPITVDVAFAANLAYAADEEIGFAVKVGADLAPVTVTAAFDGVLNDEGTTDFTYEAGLDVDVDLDPLTVGVMAYFTEDNLDTQVSVGFANDMLSADAFFGLYDILAATDLIWKTGVDVTVTPASGIEFNAGWAYASTEVMSAYADVAFTELVDNVTFKLGWEDADDLLGNDVEETDKGQIYVSAGIAY